MFLALPPATAQVKVKIDDEVKVRHLSSWYDGKVIDKQRNEFLVEFEWASRTRQEVVEREDICLLYEVDAMDYGRKWATADGKFTVVAALSDVNDADVILKKEDLTTITVPIELLSARDKSYARKILKDYEKAIASGEAPARAINMPEPLEFDKTKTRELNFEQSTPSGTVGNTTPDFLKTFDVAGVGFDLFRDDQELVAAIPVGGPEQLALVTTRKGWRGSGAAFQSQLVWVSMKQQKIIGRINLIPLAFPIDYNPRARRLLTFTPDKTHSDKGFYTLWSLTAGKEDAKPLKSWRSTYNDDEETGFATVVNENVVVACIGRAEFAAWDLSVDQQLYYFKQDSFFRAPVTVSNDRRLLIVPQDKSIVILDAATGEVVVRQKSSSSFSGAALHPDGQRLAGIDGSGFFVWELDQPDASPKFYSAPLIGNPFRSSLQWIGDGRILGTGWRSRVLYDLKLELPIWSYSMPSDIASLSEKRLLNAVVNDRFFYVARPSWHEKSVALGVVELPGPQVDETTADIDRESLLTLTPGSRMRLTIENVSDPEKVRQWMTEKMEANEWVIDPAGEFELTANAGVSESRSITYENWRTGERSTYSYTPRFTSIKIQRGEEQIWRTGTQTGPSHLIMEGESMASVVAKANNPVPIEYFQNVKLASNIIEPKYSQGFGRSLLGYRGLEVISTSPPGRPDDADLSGDEDSEEEGDADPKKPEPGPAGRPPMPRRPTP